MDKRLVRRSLFVALMGVFGGAAGTALAVNEVEQNDLLNSAQVLSDESNVSVITNGATVNGSIVNFVAHRFLPDVDFYSFYGKANKRVTIQLQAIAPLYGVLTVVGPKAGGDGHEVKQVMVPELVGDVVSVDVDLDKDGMWAVVVTPVTVMIGDPMATPFDGLFASGTVASEDGNYTIVITPATPPAAPVKTIGLNIKPGQNEWAPINPKSKGKIPVALLGSADFDPFKVELSSLTFGAEGTETSFERCAGGGGDVNGDGYRDRVCLFENYKAGFTYTSTMGYIKGMTTTGEAFEGQGVLKAVPMPRGKGKGKKK